MGTANLELPCGKCLGCRAARAIQWAHRCSHEASQWEHNTFLTLTYDDDHLPEDGALVPSDLQLFLKRLRKNADRPCSSIDRDRGSGVRFFACGEYGERTHRPHYHILLFNAGFGDGKQVGERHGHKLFRSEVLDRLWPMGRHEFGIATPAAACYIAKYNMKKIGSGERVSADGVALPAPFLRMSNRPAIGARWLERYASDLRHGYLVVDGKQSGIPRTYLNRLKDRNPELYAEITANKQRRAIESPTDNNTAARRVDADIIHRRFQEITSNRSL